MSIISTRATPSKTPTRPHDPDVCGLGGAAECDTCRATRLRDAGDFYELDDEARDRGRLRAIARRFVETTGIPLADLAAALLPHLTEPMAEIGGAVLDEREATA